MGQDGITIRPDAAGYMELITKMWVQSSVGHNTIIKEEITESICVLVYIPIIDHRAHRVYTYT